MTLSDISNKKDRLAKLYKAVEDRLKKREDWQAFRGNGWMLRFVAIQNDGSLTAIVRWGIGYPDKEQYIGVPWETAFDDAGLNAL